MGLVRLSAATERSNMRSFVSTNDANTCTALHLPRGRPHRTRAWVLALGVRVAAAASKIGEEAFFRYETNHNSTSHFPVIWPGR